MRTRKCGRRLVRFVDNTYAAATARWTVGVDAGGTVLAGWTLPPGVRIGHIAAFAHPGTCLYYHPDDRQPAALAFGYLLEASFDMVEMARRHRYGL